MREIKFRGKHTLRGNWVYGDLIHSNNKTYIKTGIFEIEVDSETVGQYTGLKDMNSKEIYEGDIIQTYDPDEGYAVVRYDETETEFYTLFVSENLYYGLGRDFNSEDIEVISNIHDNPELVGEQS